MSVLRSKRGLSNVEFLKNARDIEVAFIGAAKNKPKRMLFYINKLLDLSWDLLSECKRGNSIYPMCQEEAQLRRNHFIEARAITQALVSQIDVMRKVFKDEGFSIGQIEDLSKMLDNEIELLSGVIRNDRKRFKTLPTLIIDEEIIEDFKDETIVSSTNITDNIIKENTEDDILLNTENTVEIDLLNNGSKA